MAIELQCGECGKRYRIGENLAGKKAKCKNCGNLMVVPQRAAPSEAEADPFDLGALAGVEEDAPLRRSSSAAQYDAPVVPPPPPPAAPARRPGVVYTGMAPAGRSRKSNDQAKKGLIWGGSGLFTVFLLFKGAVLIMRAIDHWQQSQKGAAPPKPAPAITRT